MCTEANCGGRSWAESTERGGGERRRFHGMTSGSRTGQRQDGGGLIGRRGDGGSIDWKGLIGWGRGGRLI